VCNSLDLDLTEKTNNVTMAYTFFNLTSGFQFNELRTKLEKLENELPSLKASISTDQVGSSNSREGTEINIFRTSELNQLISRV